MNTGKTGNHEEMRASLITAPRWAVWLIFGLAIWAVLTILFTLDRSPAPGPGVVAFLFAVGLGCGAVIAVAGDRQRREARSAIGDLPPESLGAVVRAAWRGPVPADPRVRAAALRLAGYDSAEVRKRTLLSVPLVLLLAALAALRSEARLSTALLVAGLATAAFQWYRSRRLRERVRLLSETAESRR